MSQLSGLFMPSGIHHQHPCQRTHLHHMPLPTRRLEPGVGGLNIEMLVGGLGPGIVKIGLPLIGVESGILTVTVVIPGVGHILPNLTAIVGVDLMNGIEITVEDHPGRHQKAVGVVVALGGEISHDQEVAHPFSPGEPIFVESGHRQGIGHIDLIDETLHLLDGALNGEQPIHVEGSITGILGADRHRCTTDQEVGMGILASENGMNLHHIPLPLQGLEVVSHRHQVSLGRQFVGGVSPVGIRENSQLPSLDKPLHPLLDIGKVTGGGFRPLAQGLCQG